MSMSMSMSKVNLYIAHSRSKTSSALNTYSTVKIKMSSVIVCQGFSLQAFISITFTATFVVPCAVTVVIFGHFNRSFFYFYFTIIGLIE